jgi:hypothetical protein
MVVVVVVVVLRRKRVTVRLKGGAEDNAYGQ